MKTLKRSLAMLLSIVMFLPMMCMTVRAEYTPKYTTEAEVLFDLGLFKGTGFNADGTPVFDLDKNATRIQGIVMLIRLLGEEEAALACTAEHPFTDVPTWANSYVAYAYEKKYTNGTGNNTFGSDDKLLGKAYVTFVLRALGYNDAADDFSYNSALTFGAELGLIEAGQCEGELYRDDTALVSYNALRTTLKDSDTKLAEKLMNDGVLTENAVQKVGLLAENVTVPYDRATGVMKYSDIYEAIPNAVTISCRKLGIVNGEKGILENYKQQYGNQNYSLMSLYIKSSKIYSYATAAVGSQGYILLDPVSPNPNGKIQLDLKNCAAIITVLDKDYNLIAYSVVPPLYSGDNISFSLCHFSDRETIERIRQFTLDFYKKVPEFDLAAGYFEKIVTESDDGTETEMYRFGVDTSKLPGAMKKAKYYSIRWNNRTIQVHTRCLETYLNYFEDGGEFKEIFDFNKEFDSEYFHRAVNLEDILVFLYDENYKVIGYATTENGIRMNENN